MKQILIWTPATRLARSFIRSAWVTAALALAAPPLAPAPAQAQLSKGEGDLRVMTYNVDEGTDFIEVASATNLMEFLIAVGQTITQVRATNPPSRMQAVAKQIAAAAPMLVSLQELDQWYSGPFDSTTQTCGPVSLEFDMLQELVAALSPTYQLAYQALQYQFPPTPGLISSGPLCVQVRNYIAILARTDLSPSKFHWDNPQSAQYLNKTFFTTPSGQQLPLPRAWVSVDANFHGKPFRFIGTHLESADPTVREQQGIELREGPAKTSVPVIIAMDANAQAAPQPQDPTYSDFIASGYNDAWSEIFPRTPGFTCCQAQLVNNAVSQLFQRTDLILTLGNAEAQNIALFGTTPASKTPGGLWPSDHAAVAAQMAIERAE
jgi:hypothetical protein